MEVEHIEAHRTKKEMHQLSLFEKLNTEGDEKADEPAKRERGWTVELRRR